jgi:hypothetical protein
MSHLETNLKLVELLKVEIEKNPELRFSQILLNSGFVDQYDDTVWADEFYVRPEYVLERVEETLKTKNNPLLKKVLGDEI